MLRFTLLTFSDVIEQLPPPPQTANMPFSYAHRVHSYTLIPKVLYLHRAGKRFRVTFGPGGRIGWQP